jgi:hypothetical protein
MIILYVISYIASLFAVSLISLAVGFGKGYEAHMLEGMSKKKRNEYLARKNDMRSLNQRKYDL